MENILELKNVSVILENGRKILDNISLTLTQGEFVTIIGGNGAGKSSLFNVISGNLAVTTGEVYIFGKNVTKKSPEQRAKYLARVFQDPKMGTAPRMTVAENLAVASLRGKSRNLKLRNLKTNQAEFLEKARLIGNGLEQHLDHPTGQLSGGQRQALSLLMATLSRPELVLLDEHTAALDPKTSRSIMSLTDTLVQSERQTALMITHQMEDALKYGNRLLILKNGKIVQDLDVTTKSTIEIEELYKTFDD